LSSARYNLSATGSTNYGWFGGGYVGSSQLIVDRIDFSNDSVRASVRGPLSLARTNLAATGNSNYGWFGGGDTLGPMAPIFLDKYTSIVDRINFANDSVSASPRGPLSAARYALAATSNSTR